MRRRWICLGVVLATVTSESAWAQEYVYPRRPGKTKVEYLPQDWQTADLLVGEPFGDEEAGGVRLFFYEQEREIALRAAASIEESYRYLADAFDYAPGKRFPYVLYSSYTEFTRTNLFPIQEGVLGVTSPQSLEVTLPYFGDHRMFEDVSTHELAHQFTIQKVAAVSRDSKSWGDPLSALPLWFIEGLAEFYAKRGIDPETDMLVRDMVASPDVLRFHGLPGFWEDYPGMGLWTYKVGQVRVAFLEETYGEGTIQRILDDSPDLVRAGPIRRFRDHVGRVVGEEPEKIEERFDAWVRHREYPEWLAGTQHPYDLDRLDEADDYLTSMTTDDAGTIMAYRTIDPYTGRTRLFATDPRVHPRSRIRIAIDGHPGVESLHPVDGRHIDVGAGMIAYVAESRGHDTIRVVQLEATVRDLDEAPPWDALSEGPWVDTLLKKGDQAVYRLDDHGLVGAFSPSISPDGTEIAFVGLSIAGIRDVWVLTLGDKPRDATVRRLTDDAWAERQVVWGPDGIVYNSDATEHGKYNLFRVDPAGGEPVRLTTAADDHLDPTIAAGRVFFRTWRGVGHADLWEWTPDGIVRRTDLTTSLSEPAPGPDGSLWVLLRDEGSSRPALVPKDALLAGDPTPQLPGTEGLRPYATRSLDHSTKYESFAPGNWRPDVILGYFGAGPGGIYGQFFGSASDRLRDHSIVLTADVYGALRTTDGYLAYMNSAGRVGFGAAAFHLLRPNVDRSLGEEVPEFTTMERYYGGLASVRWPFGRFSYVQADQSVGMVQYDLYAGTAQFLAAGGLLDDWERLNGKARLQTESTLRVGLDTIRYHALTGPLAGSSALFEAVGGWQPTEKHEWATFRVDAEHYVPLPFVEGANLGFRAGAGTSVAGTYGRSFLLYSFDTLRGVRFNDVRWLLGRHYWFSRAEFQVPLDFVLRSALFSTVEGIVGLDFGGVGDNYEEMWEKRVLDIALGGNIALGPIVLRLHWAKNINTGVPVPEQRAWIPNISLSYMQL